MTPIDLTYKKATLMVRDDSYGLIRVAQKLLKESRNILGDIKVLSPESLAPRLAHVKSELRELQKYIVHLWDQLDQSDFKKEGLTMVHSTTAINGQRINGLAQAIETAVYAIEKSATLKS